MVLNVSSRSFIYDEKSETDQIVGVLYVENLNPDFYNVLLSSGLGFCVSPLHTPDEKDKKPHYHFIIREMHGHFLKYSKVHEILSNIQPNHANCLCLNGGHRALVDYARYMLHIQHPEKQQFDMREPVFYDLEIDENGFCKDTKLASAYDEKFGACCGNGLDFWKLIHVTAREKADLRRENLLFQLKSVLQYVYEHRVSNFAELAYWCEQNGFLECVVSYRDYLYKIVSSMQSSRLYIKGDDEIMQEVTYKSFTRSELVDVCEKIQKANNSSISILAPYLHWFISMFPEFCKSKSINNPVKVRQKLYTVIDINTLEPRPKFVNAYKEWSEKFLC